MVAVGFVGVQVVTEENDQTLTLMTDTETLVIAKSDIDLDENGKPERWLSTLSMMPDDQLQGMSDADVRDLVAYLASPVQVPLEADDTMAEAARGLGSTLTAQGRMDEARPHLRRYLELRPDAGDAEEIRALLRSGGS